MAPTSSRTRLWFGVLLASTLLGIVLSLYLFWEHIRLQLGIQGGSAFCQFGQIADCVSVNSSAYAKFIGIPVAAWGVLYYLLLLTLTAIHTPRSKHFEYAQRWVFWLAGAGIVFDLYLLYAQVVVIGKICPFCLTTYVVNLLAAGAALMNMRSVKPDLSWKELLLGHSNRRFRLPAGSWALSFVALTGVSLSLYILQFTQVSPPAKPESTANLDDYIREFAQKTSTLLPVKAGDGTMGNAKAKVQVVVFSDFECPFCKRAAFTVEDVARSFKDEIQVVFKNYPLDSACNSSLDQPMHPNACKLAQLAYCAGTKGKFWEYHDLVYFQLQDRGLGNRSIAEIGNDMKDIFSSNEIRDCLASSASMENAKADVALGNSLEIRSTPTVFINGKRMVLPLSPENLGAMIRAQLAVK